MQQLWPTLAPYNVVGIFCGHKHIENIYQFRPGTQYASGIAFPTQRAPYDIFESGAGFDQNFMLARITDHQMDVQATADNDFDNTKTTVPFNNFFNKRLVGTPVVNMERPVESNDAFATSTTVNGRTYIVGATAAGQYTVRVITGPTSTQFESTGMFPITPKFLLSYNLNNRGYILMSDGLMLVNYLITPETTLTTKIVFGIPSITMGSTLQQQWADTLPLLHGLTTITSPGGNPFLLGGPGHRIGPDGPLSAVPTLDNQAFRGRKWSRDGWCMGPDLADEHNRDAKWGIGCLSVPHHRGNGNLHRFVVGLWFLHAIGALIRGMGGGCNTVQ